MSRLALGCSRARLAQSSGSTISLRSQLLSGGAAVASRRGYASPSQVNKMATPVDIDPEKRAGRGSKQKIITNGELKVWFRNQKGR